MLKTRVIPCLLLKGLGLVKTIKFKDPKYVGDPINAVKIFNDKEVDELIFLDISATVEKKRPAIELITRIAGECFMPLAYGGGIGTIQDIQDILSLGAEKVSINTVAVETPELIRAAADLFGSQSIVVSIDVRKKLFGGYEVCIRGGKKATGLDPVAHAVRMEELGAGEILINSIDRDGTMQGYDTDLIKKVAGAVSIPVIACGGAGRVEDLGAAVKAGASAVSAGSMFVFRGRLRAVLINYPSIRELKEALRGD